MYHCKISDKQRLILTLCAVPGLILFFVGLTTYMLNGAEGLETVVISALFLLTALCIPVILTGAAALICQRIKGIGRELTPRQLMLGVKFSAYGSLGAGLLTLTALFLDFLFHYEGGMCMLAQGEMSLGALILFLCAAFLRCAYEKSC